MSSSISNDLVDSFCAVTGANQDRARFYLEATNGDIQLAIENYYVEGEPDGNTDEAEHFSGSMNRPNPTYDDDDDDEDNNLEMMKRFSEASKAANDKKQQSTNKSKDSSGSSKIFTLNSLNKDDDQNDEEEGDEKGQAFYAGGSETSGQQILGPPRKNPENIIKDLFKKAKESGAQEVDPGETTSKKGPVVYGAGYRLGTGNEPSEVIQGPSRPKPPKVSVLKLWKNGFNVDDGPLRKYEDPQNKEFLEAIEKGMPPKELIRQAEGGEVHLDMQDHRDEEFVPPKKAYVLYNDGYKLGSPTPTVVSNASPADQATNEQLAKRELNLDESKPTTQIQIRLSDGSKLVVKANQTHKIEDIRRYINRARPEYSNRLYSLLTMFPNKELNNENETIQQANLSNAVINQKLKQ